MKAGFEISKEAVDKLTALSKKTLIKKSNIIEYLILKTKPEDIKP
jgi:hypothetical protein